MQITPPVPAPAMPQPAGAAPAFALRIPDIRPFYRFASGVVSLSLALRVAQYQRGLSAARLPASVWHGHELLYGHS